MDGSDVTRVSNNQSWQELVLARSEVCALRAAQCVSHSWRRAVRLALRRRLADLSLGAEPVPVACTNSHDAWEHPFPSASYTPRSVGADELMRQRLREAATAGCDCLAACGAACSCAALATAGAYDSDGRLRWLSDGVPPDYHVVIIECAESCACAASCRNRVVSRGLRAALTVFRSADGRGWAVRARAALRRGQYVCEYAGELLDAEEAARRLRSPAGAMNFVMSVREHVAGGRVVLTNIDPRSRGNVGRYLNHSCSPNLASQVVRTGSVVPRLAFFARRDIAPGEELTVSYGGEAQSQTRAESLECPGAVPLAPRRRCRCGEACCVGWLPCEN